MKKDASLKFTPVPLTRSQVAGLKVAIVGGTGGIGRALARELVGKIPWGGGLIPKAAIAYAGTRVAGLSLERYYRIGKAYTRSERRLAYEDALTRGKHLSTNQSRVADPSAERERHHEIQNARPAKRDEGDRNQNSREGKKCIHNDHVEETIDRPSVVSGNRSDDEAEAK